MSRPAPSTLVDFLTPSFSDEEGLRPLKAPGVSAQSLHFLNYLIADAYADALSRGPTWRRRISASLQRMPQTAQLLEAL